MKLAELEAQLSAAQEQLTATQESLALAEADKQTALTSLSELTAENEKLAEALASVEGELASLKQDAAEAKLAARRTALAAVVAEDKVEGLMANLAVLDDAGFEAVVAGFASTKAVVEQSDLMQELGQDAEDQNSA